ncbi:MAG: hypothetical protein KDA95_07290 [Acidimicrobiales bacterium]|nr:hypothetical protein [Acidimicrobiales bacterium]
MDLGGIWRAVQADEAQRRTWLDESLDEQTEAQWSPIHVPGHWRNNDAFSTSDGPLLYRTRFEHPGPQDNERWWLRFDGVAYQGDVWLDGGYVGDTEGYFFPHIFEVTNELRTQKEHLLGVELTCSAISDPNSKRNITGSFQHAPYQDPLWNPGGIWRPVSLERTGPVRIRHLRVKCRDANDVLATVSFRAVLDASESCDVLLRSAVGDTELVEQRRLAAGENQVEWTLGIDNPELWWPHALGDQPLSDAVVEVTICDGDGVVPAGANPSHTKSRRIGLRQVNLKGWVLHVNGEKLFLKGIDLAPTRAALGDASLQELRQDLELVRDGGLDLVRVHAHIARRELYSLADEMGLVIWQDFPLLGGYARTIRKQAIRQAREAVDLLAHHPSIVMWCGHDEPFGSSSTHKDEISGAEEPSVSKLLTSQQLPSWNRSILDRSVKRAIDKADGTRPVIAHSGVLPHPPQLDGTDLHAWFGWTHGDTRELSSLAKALPRLVRFVSGLSAQSVPNSSEFMEPDNWPDLDWEKLGTRHCMSEATFDKRVAPVDHPSFESWRDASQSLQSDVIRYQIETLRLLKYRPTGGFSIRFLADTHPAVSTSLVDHERVPKLAYKALADACQPVIAVAQRLPTELVAGEKLKLDVHVVNDLRVCVDNLEISATLRWSGGERRWRFQGTVDADTVQRVGSLRIEVPPVPGKAVLELTLNGTGAVNGVTRIDSSRIVIR